ncbi:MAG: hypothetical protein HY719_08820 [Planctomycetes bacterium]|nr:hypothetical protein [Planctomycetota bacterium]
MSQNSGRSDSAIEKVANGQRFVIYAILVNLATVGLRVAIGDAGALLGIVAVVLAIVGLHRLSDGLGYSASKKVLIIVLACVPLVNLIVLVLVNSRATQALKASGYKVGLFGATR